MAPRWTAANTAPQILITFMPAVAPAGREKNLRMPHPKLARHTNRRPMETNRQTTKVIVDDAPTRAALNALCYCAQTTLHNSCELDRPEYGEFSHGRPAAPLANTRMSRSSALISSIDTLKRMLGAQDQKRRISISHLY